MNDRQAFALTHPLEYAGGDPAQLAAYRRQRPLGRHQLLTILAVDRQARLNEGMPVWHASVSLWNAAGTSRLELPAPCEKAAVRLLAGVGGEREWWIWNPVARVGHLRVNLAGEEFALVPPGLAESDAGETGPPRPRTRR